VIFQSTRTADKRQALEILKAKRQELEAARGGYINMPGPEAKRTTVAELVAALLADYKVRERRSIGPATTHLNRVREELGAIRVTDLRSKHLQAYQVARKGAGCAGSTINRELALLRRAIRPFLEEQRLPIPRFERLPENVREGFFTKAEVAAVVEHLPEELRDFTWFAFLTGWRKGETASPRWSDVDEESMTLRLSWRKSKKKQARTMSLTGELANIIKRCGVARAERVVAGHDSPYVFLRSDGRVRATKSRGRPVRTFDEVWARACTAAGLEGRLFHDLRRSAARNMDRAGVSRHVAMQITGHKTEAMYRRYNIVNDADIKAALKETADYLDSLPTKTR
jgi:integrase